MHNILEKTSTFKLQIKRYMRELEDEINALEFMVMGARHYSELYPLITYAEYLKRKLRAATISIIRYLDKERSYFENKFDRFFVQIENIMRPLEELYLQKTNNLESV